MFIENNLAYGNLTLDYHLLLLLPILIDYTLNPSPVLNDKLPFKRDDIIVLLSCTAIYLSQSELPGVIPMRCCHLSAITKPKFSMTLCLRQTSFFINLFILSIISIFDVFSYKNYNVDKNYFYMCIMPIPDINVFFAFKLVALSAFAQMLATH